MISESLSICRVLLGATGLGTIVMGATAPVESIWPKLVAVLGGLVATMVSIMFGTFMKHIYSHSERAEDQIDKKLITQTKLCSAELHESIREAVRRGIVEGIEEDNRIKKDKLKG